MQGRRHLLAGTPATATITPPDNVQTPQQMEQATTYIIQALGGPSPLPNTPLAALFAQLTATATESQAATQQLVVNAIADAGLTGTFTNPSGPAGVLINIRWHKQHLMQLSVCKHVSM